MFTPRSSSIVKCPGLSSALYRHGLGYFSLTVLGNPFLLSVAFNYPNELTVIHKPGDITVHSLLPVMDEDAK